MFFYKYLLLIFLHFVLNAGLKVSEEELETLKIQSKGIFYTENDYLLIAKLFLTICKLNGSKDITLDTRIMLQYINQYLENMSFFLLDKEVVCDKVVSFYVIPNISKEDLYQKLKKDNSAYKEISSIFIMNFLEENYQIQTLPLTLFQRKINLIKFNKLSFFQVGRDLIFVVDINNSTCDCSRELLLKFFELINFQNGIKAFN